MEMIRDRPAHKIRCGLIATAIVMAAMLCPKSVFAVSNITINMHRSATVGGDVVYLGDVADILADDQSKIEKLSRIKVENAPLAGESRLVHPDKVKVRLKQFGLNEDTYQLSASCPVKVLRSYAVVTPMKINAAVKTFIQRHAPWQADQMKLDKFTFKNDITVPPGKISLLVTAPKHTDWLGPVPFSVQVLVDGKRIGKITAPATIEVWSDVVLSVKPLGKYQPIDPDDIIVKQMNLARVPSNAILNADRVLGRRTNRSIAANSILRSDQVEMPPVVRRGDVVQVIAETAILKVAAKGMVKENGAVGDRIQVMNLRSKKIIYAQVVDEQTVAVEF